MNKEVCLITIGNRADILQLLYNLINLEPHKYTLITFKWTKIRSAQMKFEINSIKCVTADVRLFNFVGL